MNRHVVMNNHPVRVLCAAFVILGLTACRTASIGSSLQGRVVDPGNKPVAGVSVDVQGRRPVRTDADGFFSVLNVVPSQRVTATFSAPWFMDTTRVYSARDLARRDGNVVIIWPRAESAKLNASSGGALTFPGGSVTIPAASLVDRRGRTIVGDVQVSLSVLDMTDRRQVTNAPGDFTARMRDDSIRQLETFGIFEVFVTDPRGERANLAYGRTATVQMNIPEWRRASVPETVGLFSFDTFSGRWVEEGTIKPRRDKTAFAMPVDSFTGPWNADQILDTTCIKIQVLDGGCGLAPGASGALVKAEGADYVGASPDAYADANGFACISVKLGGKAKVTAYHASVAGVQTNPLELTALTHVASAADCSDANLCPLVAITHFGAPAFSDPMSVEDSTHWSRRTGTNTGDPNFGVTFDDSNAHIDFPGSAMTITLSDYADQPANACPANCDSMPHASGEYRTDCFYGYGTYKATFRAARGSGLVTTFFTYSDANDGGVWHDEIDVEVLGRTDTCPGTMIHTNFFADQTGAGNPEDVCVSFDASLQAHTYEFVWSPTQIDWYVDRGTIDEILLRTAHSTDYPKWPVQPGRIMLNMWSGTAFANGWLGPFVYPGTPIQVEYDLVEYTP